MKLAVKLWLLGALVPALGTVSALLVAGGIGVTPVHSHAKALVRDGGTAEIVARLGITEMVVQLPSADRDGVWRRLDELSVLL